MLISLYAYALNNGLQSVSLALIAGLSSLVLLFQQTLSNLVQIFRDYMGNRDSFMALFAILQNGTIENYDT